ncbi:MAG: M28 family peptidase [Methylococcaceae bacterium]|nr:M28 family peptidase [Methylococcaceae bacterium]
MKPEITPDRLRSHVHTLASEIGERNVFKPKALHEAEDYITRTWRQQGYLVTRQAYEVQGVECANLEVTRTGSAAPDEMILIGAHYDSVNGSPGANDNGSGVAALLELSRLFANHSPDVSVRFVAFVNEEPPFFYWGEMGSAVYAKAARARGDRIRFMASVETIGYYSESPGSQNYPPLFKYFYPDRGNFISFVSNLGSRAVMREAARAFRAGSSFPIQHVATFSWIPGVAWSDHLCFWRQGYRAFMVTDTAFYRYRFYHTPYDTADQLCYEPFAQCCNGLFHCFGTLARGK